jgi:hypothetical protein
MNFTPSAFGREYNYPFKVCKQTLELLTRTLAPAGAIPFSFPVVRVATRMRDCHENGRVQLCCRTHMPTGALPIFILHGARANEHLRFGTGPLYSAR